jgi:hypothetical protein
MISVRNTLNLMRNTELEKDQEIKKN